MVTGTDIANKAQSAMDSSHFVDVPGCCQMFARQVAEAVGSEVGARMDEYRTGTAKATMENFRGTEFDVWERGDGDFALQEGDFLYKGSATSGPAGHVGIVANGRREGLDGSVVIVYENSSYHEVPGHQGNIEGAKGWRTLDKFGPYEMVVRLA
jgi:cell wall-associated NlpC family hydrolase